MSSPLSQSFTLGEEMAYDEPISEEEYRSTIVGLKDMLKKWEEAHEEWGKECNELKNENEKLKVQLEKSREIKNELSDKKEELLRVTNSAKNQQKIFTVVLTGVIFSYLAIIGVEIARRRKINSTNEL